ncbi:putative Lipase (class 3) [Trypanosoma vivax]|uniref:sn-1-specific diacylglycerol lipase n=2 Tax=Trypanosoma vivax (strain Y486) TaxID=1055687 RepID=G0U494_TRYVY|nr:putative Lipase (class 3) [Trypanosoma vivax]CCC52257.1 conserved hypothetical protein [Trypanosoma vivax Y486]
MKKSAEYVLCKLHSVGILSDILEGKFRNHRVVVLGHSLGAGVAAILSIILHATYCSARSRIQCFAYAPPGGLLSPALVSYSKDFIVGCFSGNDIVPRMAVHTFDDLRDLVLSSLARCNISKSSLFLKKCFRAKVSDALAAPVFDSFSGGRVLLERLRETSYSPHEEARRLFPPMTLVHFRKAVVLTRTGSCFQRICSGCRSREEVFVPMFVSPADVQMIVCSSTMFTDHFPDRLFNVMEKACDRLERGELSRFFFPIENTSSSPTRANEGIFFSGMHGAI